MVKDSASHAAEDRSRRDFIDARNQGDSLAYQVENTVNENREKAAQGELSRIEAAIAEVRKVVRTDDVAAIRRAAGALQQALHEFATTLYKGSPGSKESQASPDFQGSSGSRGSNVVKDAEVVDGE